MTEKLPAQYAPEPEVLEPEIVGYEPPVPLWRRIAHRAAIATVLGLFALASLLAGVILTITLVGAALGIPLIFFGLLLLALALFIFFGGGNAQFRIRRYP